MNVPGQPARRVLLCGERAFAARGLGEALRKDGCSVTGFSRGEPGRIGETVNGAADQIHLNAYLYSTYDTVVNFIVLKGRDRQENLAYLRSLLSMCKDHSVKHLVHISSMSVYPDGAGLITERTAVRNDPTKPPFTYADLKTATDAYLRQHVPAELRLSLLRPAYILGEGMDDPIGSIGRVISAERLLVLGRPNRPRPLISRSVLHAALRRLVQQPPREHQEVLLMVDPASPSCLDYLQKCCESLGVARSAASLPLFMWVPCYLAHERERKGASFSYGRFLRGVFARSQLQHYDPGWTEGRLGMSLRSNWQADLLRQRHDGPTEAGGGS